jgi:hypothetical protein
MTISLITLDGIDDRGELGGVIKELRSIATLCHPTQSIGTLPRNIMLKNGIITSSWTELGGFGRTREHTGCLAFINDGGIQGIAQKSGNAKSCARVDIEYYCRVQQRTEKMIN